MAASNPFLRLRARTLLLGMLGLEILITLLLGSLEFLGLLPLDSGDPLLAPVIYVLIFGLVSLWGLGRFRQLGIDLRHVLGPWPTYPWRSIILLTSTLLLFSLGAFQLSYYFLSLMAPALVEQVLQNQMALFDEQTAVPWLYNSLLMVTVILVAPLAEEFLFRGILIHRWGCKWGIRPALIVSSLLFGLLHANLIGLTMFGLVMGLLYLRTGSLAVPILCHLLNNLLAISLELLAALSDPVSEVDPLKQVQSNWWLGVVCLLVSLPVLMRFIRTHWPPADAPLPYFKNVGIALELSQSSGACAVEKNER